MKFVTVVTFLGLASKTCGYSDSRVDTIVNDVTAGNYADALVNTFALEAQNRRDLIREAVDGLFNNTVTNLFDYGYRLKNAFRGNAIFTATFPIQIRRVLNQKRVRIVNREDMFPLKLGSRNDSAGDRTAYGDGSGAVATIVAWEFISVFANRTLTFNIMNVRYEQYLKLGVQVDGFGDHTAYGSDEVMNDRFSWYLVPFRYRNSRLFYIVNKQYEQALKLSRAVDSDGDRTAYGNNGTYRGSAYLAWYLNEF